MSYKNSDENKYENERLTEAFLELAGTWQDDRSADEIIASIRKVRNDSKQTKRFIDVLS